MSPLLFFLTKAPSVQKHRIIGASLNVAKFDISW